MNDDSSSFLGYARGISRIGMYAYFSMPGAKMIFRLLMPPDKSVTCEGGNIRSLLQTRHGTAEVTDGV